MKSRLARVLVGAVAVVVGLATLTQPGASAQDSMAWEPYRVTVKTVIYEDPGSTVNSGPSSLVVGDIVYIRPTTASGTFAEVDYIQRVGKPLLRVTDGNGDTDYVRSTVIERTVDPGWRWGTG
ncbi:hypothetical protein [Knoellia sp. LjRoot47]|uniref:hypothetical protein n=1 Tax=Knoellia sp. LjRoot47 TaxID=3342330 RepID=UPI003ECE4816